MSQLMKRQLEHQSSAPQNISTWETGFYPHRRKILFKRSAHIQIALDYTLTRQTELQEILMLYMNVFLPPGITKTSLLSAPSTVSMFVPAPEDFSDEQPTNMADRQIFHIQTCMLDMHVFVYFIICIVENHFKLFKKCPETSVKVQRVSEYLSALQF